MLPCNARVVLENFFAKFKGGRIAKAVYNIRNYNCSKLTPTKIQHFFHLPSCNSRYPWEFVPTVTDPALKVGPGPQ